MNFYPPAVATTTKQNDSTANQQLSGCNCDPGTVMKMEAEHLLAPLHHENRAGGEALRIRPEHRAKAERFWASLSAKRKQPGRCCRCGRPHGGKFRQCDPCRVRVAAAKAKRAAKGVTMAECVAMVRQCRREVTKLREIIKQMQRAKERKNQRAYREKKTLNKYHDAWPSMSAQELATMNHAYASP